MPDMDAIAGAIATRFARANVAAPAGETNVRSSTASLPATIGALPAVLVIPDHGDLESAGQTRIGVHDFKVQMFVGPYEDLPRETNRSRKWLSILLDQLRTTTQLGGLTGGSWRVDRARVASWRLGELSWGDKRYVGLELVVRVTTSEGWSASA